MSRAKNDPTFHEIVCDLDEVLTDAGVDDDVRWDLARRIMLTRNRARAGKIPTGRTPVHASMHELLNLDRMLS